jgi:hypothetical protein
MKSLKKIPILGLVGGVTLGLTACDIGVSGQIDKCVRAGIESSGPYKNEKEKVETEFLVRAHCLNAASGKS